MTQFAYCLRNLGKVGSDFCSKLYLMVCMIKKYVTCHYLDVDFNNLLVVKNLCYSIVIVPLTIMAQHDNDLIVHITDYMQQQASLVFEEGPYIKGSDFLSKGFCPLQITIRNKSNKTFVLPRAGIRFPLVSYKEVLTEMQKQVSYVGWGALSFVTFVIFFVTSEAVIELYQGYKTFPYQRRQCLLGSLAGSLGLGVFSYLHKAWMLDQDYEALCKVLKKEVFTDDIIIKPGNTKSVLFFICTKDYYTDKAAMIELYELYNNFNTHTFVVKEAMII